MSPTARSLTLLRQLGFLAAPVERYIAQVERKVDLFRIADVLAVHPRDRLFLLVQATSIGHVGDRLKRCKQRPELALWLKAGGLFQVWGWAVRDGKWTCKVVEVQAESLEPMVLQAPRRRVARKNERQAALPGME